MRCGFAYTTPYGLTPVYPLTGTTTFLRHPIAYLMLVRVVRAAGSGPKTSPALGT
jgi:hypothetical protein